MAVQRPTLVDVEGRALRLTNLDKVLWPAVGYTKRQMLAYYAAAGPTLLPHVAGRPMTLKRYPEGVDGSFWFQQECPDPPEWMRTHRVDAAGDERVFDHCVVDDLPGLLWVANLGTIELQPALWTTTRPQDASFAVLDLDPGDGVSIVECCQVALQLQTMLDRESIGCYVKTSGRKGLHVYLPLRPGTSFDEAKRLARSLAAAFTDRSPERIVDDVSVEKRKGKVLIDWRQTARLRQLCCPYSLRAGASPTVSMPLMWDEVAATAEVRDAAPLRFSPGDALDRIDRHGDLFAPVLATSRG